MISNLLIFLWGMFFGYIVASVNYAVIIINKGYRYLSEIPDKDCDEQ